MRHALLMFILVGILLAGDGWNIGTAAHVATPVASPLAGTTTLVLVEHNDHETILDLGDPGPSAGDLLVWGPNPLHDAADDSDTEVTSQGTCVTLHDLDTCLLNETVAFPDGSTLQIQGIERKGGLPSARTIVGGSGRFLGATGSVAVEPTVDEQRWTKTFTIVER